MSDVEILHAMVTAFRDAIVSKNAVALAALFAVDADFVNIAAMRWNGRTAIEANHAKMFAGPLQITLEVTRVDTRFLRDDVALVAASWKRDTPANVTGPALPPGSGELTFVATRGTEGWLFASAQNTQAMTLPGGPSKG